MNLATILRAGDQWRLILARGGDRLFDQKVVVDRTYEKFTSYQQVADAARAWIESQVTP